MGVIIKPELSFCFGTNLVDEAGGTLSLSLLERGDTSGVLLGEVMLGGGGSGVLFGLGGGMPSGVFGFPMPFTGDVDLRGTVAGL